MAIHRGCPFIAAFVVRLTFCSAMIAEAPRAIDLLPNSTLIYAEINEPSQVIKTILEHPLRSKLEATPQWKDVLGQPDFLEFKAILSIIEAQIGMQWRTALEKLGHGGIHIGLDSKTNGFALLAKCEDKSDLEKVVNTLVKLGRDDAKQKGEPDPYKTATYRDFQVYETGEVKFALANEWFVATDQNELGKFVLDQLIDRHEDSLAGNTSFQEVYRKRDKRAAIWAYANLNAIRDAGAAPDLFSGKTENLAVELLLGGIMNNLEKTPHATAALFVDDQKLRLSFATPHDSTWVSDSREHFFGPAGKGSAPPLIHTKDTIFSLGTYRNIAELWLRAGDLFDASTNDGLAQAESNLTTFFSGKDFAQEILGAVHPEVQFTVSRHDFGDQTPQPAVKLPAFAAIFRLRDPEMMRTEFRRVFQSLIGFINIVGAMDGQPQLDQDSVKTKAGQVYFSTYIPEPMDANSKNARINFNFSPAIGFSGDRFIISSTTSLAKKLTFSKLDKSTVNSQKNTLGSLNGSLLADVLADNREQFIAQNMLEEGNSRAEAEQEIGLLLMLARAFRTAEIQLTNTDKLLQLTVEIQVAREI